MFINELLRIKDGIWKLHLPIYTSLLKERVMYFWANFAEKWLLQKARRFSKQNAFILIHATLDL